MKIGIDIDDTTVFTIKSMLKYADIFEEEIKGVPGNRNNLGLIKNRYYLEALYGWNDITKKNFFNKYYKDVLLECEILPDANTIINKLKNDGNEIHFITARLMDIDGCDTKSITINTLNKNNILYDSLSLGIKDKLSFCLENHINLLIEDSYETCKELASVGIKAILMTTKMNKDIIDNSITRVNSWDEVYTIVNSL